MWEVKVDGIKEFILFTPPLGHKILICEAVDLFENIFEIGFELAFYNLKKLNELQNFQLINCGYYWVDSFNPDILHGKEKKDILNRKDFLFFKHYS